MKKRLKVVPDDIEDLEIKAVAHHKDSTISLTAIVMFAICLVVSFSLLVYSNYMKGNNNYFELKKDSNRYIVSLTNDKSIDETINHLSFQKNTRIQKEQISQVEVKVKNKQANKLKVNLNYDIKSNPFDSTNKPNMSSPVLVRFAYSYDKVTWTYLNNVLLTSNNNIIPLVGNYYDVSGYNTNINVLLNYEINNNEIIYFKAETIFNKQKKYDDKKYIANFYVNLSI